LFDGRKPRGVQGEDIGPGIDLGEGDLPFHEKLFRHSVVMAEKSVGLDEDGLVPDDQIKDIFLVCQPEGGTENGT